MPRRLSHLFIPPSAICLPRFISHSYTMTSPTVRRSSRLASKNISSTQSNSTPSQPTKRRKKVAAVTPTQSQNLQTPPPPSSSSNVPPPVATSIPNASTTDQTKDNLSQPSVTHLQQNLLNNAQQLSHSLINLSFVAPVTHIYNPLEYAWEAHKWYIRKYVTCQAPILLVGMNPGPWGMAQTWVPFGEVNAVRDFLHMPPNIQIGKPVPENPARPVTGLQCKRSEVSGRRLWTEWAHTDYEHADTFFQQFYVYNYCPLMWMEKSGRNRTPVQLPAAKRREVEVFCDQALKNTISTLKPKAICGIGGYAAGRCQEIMKKLPEEEKIAVFTVLHPSPASPAANKGWVDKFRSQIKDVFAHIESK